MTSSKIHVSDVAEKILKKRYYKVKASGELETASDMIFRVANAVAYAEKPGDREKVTKEFVEIMERFEFLPNSPALMNAGTANGRVVHPKSSTGQLAACFVLPVEDSLPKIFETLGLTAMIHKSGGGTGFSFSKLRPKDDTVGAKTNAASGPLSFMTVFDKATEVIKQGGARRGANMGVIRVDHPDVEEIIDAKINQSVLNNFNISIDLTNAFMEAVVKNTEYDLLNPRTGEVLKSKNAREVFKKIVKNAWENGEPGIIFMEKINEASMLRDVFTIESTNPCGEQPLPPYGSCVLGSVNVGKFVKNSAIDFKRLEKVVRTSVRFLDNVIDINHYPDSRIKDVSKNNRQIGLGVMGWADVLSLLGIKYGSDESLKLGKEVMALIQYTARDESSRLGRIKGNFPNFEKSEFPKLGFENMRNGTVTTIAPTGTISIIAGASSGIEPHFAVCITRRQADEIMHEVNETFKFVANMHHFEVSEAFLALTEKSCGSIQHLDAPEELKRAFPIAHDITPDQHIRMQAVFQQHTDNAVSKTINMPETATIADVENAYLQAFSVGLKGITVYRDGSRSEQVLSASKEASATIPKIVDALIPPGKRMVRERPSVLKGYTYNYKTGCGDIYVTINEDDTGLFEVFTTMGKAGGCAASQAEAIGRLTSLSWRAGVSAKEVVKQLSGIACHMPAGFGDTKILSCADAVAKAIAKHMMLTKHDVLSLDTNHSIGACPECAATMTPDGGCFVCQSCGYSACS